MTCEVVDTWGHLAEADCQGLLIDMNISWELSQPQKSMSVFRIDIAQSSWYLRWRIRSMGTWEIYDGEN